VSTNRGRRPDRRIGVAGDARERLALIAEAARRLQDDWAYIPLHRQVLLRTSKAAVGAPQSADGMLQLRLVDPAP
jgi:hypothetical protein